MTAAPTAKQLMSYIERIERIEEARDEETAARKEVYKELKDEGYDSKAVRKIVRIRKMEPAKRKEEEEILGAYMDALGIE